LLKLLFAQRAGLDRLPLLEAQSTILAETVLALEAPAPGEEEAAQTARMFRLETARAGLRFVEAERLRIAGH
jgi:hypothetical protein